MAGGLSRSRAEALQALQGVVMKQHLETNQFAKQVRRAGKVGAWMRRRACEAGVPACKAGALGWRA